MYLGTLRRWVRLLGCIVLSGAVIATASFHSSPAHATAGINQQINYQGRLYNSAGATVPDGYYNIQFKIYQDGDGQSAGNSTGSPAGSLLWTESHLNVNSQGVQIKNGFMSVELGSVTPFGSSIDWNQDKLWVSLNIGSTNGACASFASCTPDGEMLPMKRLSAVPYALNANQLGGLTSAGFIQNTTAPQSADFNINGTGIAATLQGGSSVLTPLLDTITAGTALNIGTTNANAINLNQNVTVATGKTFTSQGVTTVKTTSTTAFDVQNAGSVSVFTVNTSTNRVGVNNQNPNYELDVTGAINSTTGYRINGVAGASALSCASNSVLQGTNVNGGIVTSGTCKGNTLQNSYENSGNAPVKVQEVNTNNGSGTSITSAVSATTQGNLLVAVIGVSSGASVSVSSITDTAGNTWALAGSSFVSGVNARTEIWYAKNASPTTSITATFSGSNASTAKILEYSNIDPSSPLDVAATQGNASNTNAPTNSITTNNSTDLVIAAMSYVSDTITSTAPGSPWSTYADNTNTAPSPDKQVRSAYRFTSATGTYNTSWTLSSAAASGTVIAAFKAVGGVTSTADINLTNAKDLRVVAADTATDANVIIDLQCASGCSTNGRFAIQNAGVDVLTVAPNSGGITLGKATVVAADLTVTSAGNVSFQKGADYSTVGSTNDVNFGSGVLFRLTGASAQTITGIAGGIDGRTITLVNAASQSAILSNNSGSSSATNRIITGSGADITLVAGSSISLIYDSGASLWRVIGAAGTGGSYIELQGSTPGSAQTGNFNITGTGIANILQAATFDTGSATALNIGTTNATAINLNQNVTVAAGKTLTIAGGVTGTRPGSPTEGMVYYDTTTKQLLTYANGKWQADRSTSTKIVAANNSTQAAKDAADYVADGTGDQTEINSALSAASGGKVYLMEGTYVANATITIPNNTTLAGAGRGTLIELADLDATDNLVENSDTTTGTGVTIQDIRFDGRIDLNTAGTQYGIYLNNMGGGTGSSARQGAKLTNIIISRFRTNNVMLDASSNGTYSGINSQASGGNGFIIDGASRQNTFTNNVAQGNTTNGFQITGSSGYNTLSGNVAQGNTSAGIALASASDNNTITGNTLRSNGTNGITVGASSGNTINGNTAVANTGDGINVTTGANQNTISGNTATTNTGDGIEINGSQYNAVTGNSAQGNTANGFTVTNANNNNITGNTARSNVYGIYINSSDSTTVSSNNLNGNTTYGIYLATANTNLISSNRIVDSGGATTNNAIYLSASDSNSIVGNSITDSSASSNNYSINIFNATSDTNNLSDNTLGAGTINNAGTGTVYGGQSTAANGTDLLFRQAASTSAFSVQDAGGAGLLTVDSTNGEIEIGSSTAAGKLVISDGSSNTATILVSALSGNYTVTIPTITGNDTFCLVSLANCTATPAQFIQNQNASAQATANFWLSGTGRADSGLLAPSLDTASAGTLNIGTTTATTIQIGNPALASGTQTINIGNSSTAGGTTNVTIGSGGSASAGITTVQAKDSVAISTNGTTRATFNNANSVYFGNGVTAAAPNAFTVSGTGSSTTAVAGGALTVQGGNATVGNANGGNLTLTGGTGVGTGVNGLVVIATPTFSTTANDPNCYTGGALVASTCTIAAASVNNSSAIIVGFSASGQTANLPDPTTVTAGRIVYLTAANGSSDFTLSVNGGGTGNTIAMRQNTTATMIWNGTDWTAAGASSSTTLQSAYDNTLQSAGGAELVVSSTSNTRGLTIRDSSTSPVNGTLVSVQTSSAAGLLSVNSNVTEYASNAGAETAGGSATTFPASTWSAITGATVSRHATAGNYIATGQGSVSVATTTTALSGVKNQLSTTLSAGNTYNISFTTRLLSGTFTDLEAYYSIDGTASSVLCTNAKAAITSVWTKVNCTFTAPSSGITSGNAIFIRQTGAGTARTFYVDNLSVTIAADYNFATDGSVNDSGNFATNWSFVNATSGVGSVTRSTADGYDASDSASVTLSTGAANAGLRNKLSVNPLTNTLYRITVYGKLSAGSFTDFKVRYAPTGSTGSSGTYTDCVDYNTQTLTTSGWTKITCYIQTDGTTPTTPYVNFVETTSTARTFLVDAFSMTLSTSSTPNVQIGGGVNGGPTTLLTLDKGASAPIASDNESLLGSMYYDTTLGKLQCYEADGWGACGSSPDNVITISPEYTNAVLNGTGIGTMTSSICSDALNLNDGSSGQPTICGSNETYNFYKWTSPQSTAQTYAIYVTYQLPAAFKDFASGQTSLMGRTDSANSTVNYQVYRNSTSGLTACGSTVAVSTGVQTAWQTGIATGSADPTTCSFAGGDSIVFKINVTASSNANAYVGNLNFTFSNR